MNDIRLARIDRQERLSYLGGPRAYRHHSTMAIAMLEGLLKSPQTGSVEQRIALNVRNMR